MKRLLLVMTLGLSVGCSADVTTSQPFKIKDVEYLQGSFGTNDRTIITGEDGSRHILPGHYSTPARGTEVVIIHRDLWGGPSTTIRTVKDE